MKKPQYTVAQIVAFISAILIVAIAFTTILSVNFGPWLVLFAWMLFLALTAIVMGNAEYQARLRREQEERELLEVELNRLRQEGILSDEGTINEEEISSQTARL